MKGILRQDLLSPIAFLLRLDGTDSEGESLVNANRQIMLRMNPDFPFLPSMMALEVKSNGDNSA
jgi:hypothetical protein